VPKKKPTRGGRRAGAGRKPSVKPRKRLVCVSLAADVDSYLIASANRSASVEGAVRASLGYRLWQQMQEDQA
jgi:ABC-type phosphate/phosphonate transport system permease subunit